MAARQDLTEQATGALVAEAERLIESGDASKFPQAAEAIRTCLVLAPNHPRALRLQDALTVIGDAPEGFAFVSGGAFPLGSQDPQDGNPSRSVDIEPFFIAIHEVTVDEYRRFIDADGYRTRQFWSEEGWQFVAALAVDAREPLSWSHQKRTPGRPLVGISAYEAEAFGAWLSETRAERLRVATDDEWEIAARYSPGNRTVSRAWPFGNLWAAGGLDGATQLQPIGKNAGDTSGFGCKDMAGNAAEWVRLPDDDAGTSGWALRGSSNSMPGGVRKHMARTTKRGHSTPGHRSMMVGFRLVCPVRR